MKGLNKEQRTEKLKKIQETFQKAREYSDDKVQIAMQMYEMVSQRIRAFTNRGLVMLMRDAEGRKKEASKVIQTTRQSNTAHPRQSLFLRKMSCLGWDSNPRHSTL